jgi:hypothetical protein
MSEAVMDIRSLPTFPAGEFRKNLADMVIRAGFKNEIVAVSHHGKPLAALVPIDLVKLWCEAADQMNNTSVQNEIFLQILQRMRSYHK